MRANSAGQQATGFQDRHWQRFLLWPEQSGLNHNGRPDHGGSCFYSHPFKSLGKRTDEQTNRTIWIADAHRDDGKRFVVRADEKLSIAKTLPQERQSRHGAIAPRLPTGYSA